MRARDFITEEMDLHATKTGGKTHQIEPDHKGALKNVTTYPNQNMNAGNQYMNYRMGLALAGAPDYPTKAASYIAGDPLLAPYTEEEMEMINFAAKQIGDSSRITHTSKRSEELSDVQKTSPVAKPQRNRYGV
jgi:hypothetical protein